MSVESSTVKGVFMDGDNASYDRNAKKFLSEKALLARILKDLVAEFRALSRTSRKSASRASRRLPSTRFPWLPTLRMRRGRLPRRKAVLRKSRAAATRTAVQPRVASRSTSCSAPLCQPRERRLRSLSTWSRSAPCIRATPLYAVVSTMPAE